MRFPLHVQKLLDLLLFSNVFIACCAVAQGGLTYLLLNLPVNYGLLIILGCATLAMYNFSMILAKPARPDESTHRRVRWIFRHERSLWAWTIGSMTVLVVLGFTLHTPSFVLLTIFGVMAAAYNLPIFPLGGGGKRVGMRQFAGLKLFHIGFIWAASVVLLPVAEAYHDGVAIAWPQVWILTVWVFLFVVAITIPFDVRDVYQDRYYGLRTVAVLFGEWWALALATALLAVHGIWVAYSSYPVNVKIALMTVSLVAELTVAWSRNKPAYYYFLLIDGLLIFQFLAVWIVVN